MKERFQEGIQVLRAGDNAGMEYLGPRLGFPLAEIKEVLIRVVTDPEVVGIQRAGIVTALRIVLV